MGKKKGPSPPDPVKTAQAQYEYNRKAAEDSARFNQINQCHAVGQYGYWSGEIGSPDRTQHTDYNPTLQRILFGDTYHPHFGGGGGGRETRRRRGSAVCSGWGTWRGARVRLRLQRWTRRIRPPEGCHGTMSRSLAAA